MSGGEHSKDIRAAWQAETEGITRISSSDLRARMNRVSRKAWRRTVGGLIVCAAVVGSLAYVWRVAPWHTGLARAGIVLTCLGLGMLALQLITHGDANRDLQRRMCELGGRSSLEFHRWQIARQRDFHRGWQLYTRLLMLTAGGLLFLAGFALEHPEVARTLSLVAAASVLLALAAVPVNRRLARRYQDQLDELDSLSGFSS
jgi:hypothetical protein